MKQNIYDNESFYGFYIDLRAKSAGLNDVIEVPAFRSLLPDVKGKDILDLGCGFGESCKWYVSQGAGSVTGVDISRRMIRRARERFSDKRTEYLQIPIEEAHFPEDKFDLVLNSLAFHCVADYETLVKKICRWLKPEGLLIFSQEHPIATAKMAPDGWVEGADGHKMHWILDNYNEEGLREQNWFVNGVIKYHRTVGTIANTLINNGFKIVKIMEPTASREAESLNRVLQNERRRPLFLIMKAQRLS